MIKTRIIPCLDVDNGRVVKGINFVNLVDAGDPVKQAKFYSENGADEITFLDITATHEKREAMVDIIERTANECLVPLTVGGGIRSVDDMSGVYKTKTLTSECGPVTHLWGLVGFIDVISFYEYHRNPHHGE